MFNNQKRISIFGKTYQLFFLDSLDLPYGCFVKGKKLIVNKFASHNQHHHLLDRFLKNTASKYILTRISYLAKLMKLEFGKVSLKQQRTRWGSCSSQKNLNFNWRLVHFPAEVIDYVIIHELSHLKHLDHSRDFWKLVEKFDPEYKKHRGFLKRTKIRLG